MAPTSYTPIYSNAAIQILGYALEAITNSTYSSLLSKHILEPLKMTHSSFSKPADKDGIIPFNATSSGWNLEAGDETP
jgi:CubicO group peptidase (beta-lactamase class C family)